MSRGGARLSLIGQVGGLVLERLRLVQVLQHDVDVLLPAPQAVGRMADTREHTRTLRARSGAAHMTPLTSSTCRCTSFTFEEELAMLAQGGRRRHENQ